MTTPISFLANSVRCVKCGKVRAHALYPVAGDALPVCEICAERLPA